ncbi:DUF3310 domain-containing protein [Paenarthrobacter nitroguajacolicus]|uniref:DUF3310 domain-containing protein n=1 Tax=Paenarthrobacter nitroguajacolicus TaxID=211146 RepID=UPI003AE1602F
MSKFKIGDPVRVIEQTSSYFDRVGHVREISSIRGYKLPFGVIFDTSDTVIHFGTQELILAEHPTVADDPVNHPAHYGGADDPYEVIKVAEAWGFDKDAYLFNVLKYIARAGKKGATLQDHKKAHFYLGRKIQRLEAGE